MTGTLIILQPEHSSTDSRPGTRGTPPWSEMIKRQKLKFLITAPPVSQVECHVPAINMVTFLADTRTPSLPPQIRNPIISISAVLCQCAGLHCSGHHLTPLHSCAVQSPQGRKWLKNISTFAFDGRVPSFSFRHLLFLSKKKGGKWNKNIYLLPIKM